MQDFNADCTIKVWVEALGKPAKLAWACEIAVGGRSLVRARKFLGIVPREEAELSACVFGVSQAARLLQEKVELRASFSAEDTWEKRASPGRGRGPDLQSERTKLARLWNGIRLRRVARLTPAEASAIGAEAKKAFRRHKEEED